MAGNELFIQGKKYISLKRASELSGYAKDYVGQICRCGKIKSERIGRDWFVDLEDLLCYKKNKIESIKKVLQQKENSVSSVLVQAPLDGKIDNKNKDISSRRAIEIGAIFENFKNKASGFFSTKDSWDKELFEGRGERLTAKFAKSLAYGFAVILLIFGFVRYSSKAGEIYAQLYNIGSSVKIVEIHPVRNFYGALDKLANVSLPRVEFPEISLAKNARKISDAYLATIYSTGDALTSFSVGASNKTVALLNQAKALELPEIKMPGIALPKIHKPNFSKIVLALVNVKHSVFDTASNMAFVGNIFSDTAKNILMETKNSFALFPQNVKEIVSEFLGLPAQTGVKDFFAPRSELAIDQNYNESVYQQEINSLKLELSQIKNNGFTVQSPIVQKTIVEKSVEKIISGLTSEEIDARLNETNEKLMAQILDIKNRLAYRTDSIANATVASTYQAVALTNKIDSLSGVTINNATITGTLGGLTDAMIPDSITASNYLLLSGGTISGELTITATTTLNGVAYGWPSADGSANYVLSTNGAGVLSWAAQTGGGGTINQLGQIGDVSTSTLAYGHLLMWNGVDTWQDTATSSLGITSGITSLNGQTGATQTFATSSDTNIGLTITSSGNIHTFTSNWIGSLAVGRGGTGLTSYTSGDVLYANTTSTLAGTSTANLKTTLGLNLVENTALSSWAGSTNITTLGTITAGTWNGSTIGVGFGGTGLTSATAGYVLIGNSATALQATSTLFVSPAGEFTVQGSGASGSTLTIGDTTANDAGVIFDGNAQDYYFALDDTDDALKIGLGSAIGTTPYLTVLSTGNTGIGTTSPYAKLSVWGSGASGLTKVFEAVNSASTTLFTILDNGRVGIGTTDPLQKLHVEGQCVTGDTLLPIIRQENFQFSIFNFSARGGSASGGQTISNDSISKQKQKEEFIENYNIENCLEIENCKLEIKPIVDVKAGDYVLSLNEETNKIEPHRINGLLDMGVKPIYEIETEDGKKIRTTGNHPYLARNQSKDLARLGFGTVENSYAKHSQDDNSGNDVNNGISHNKLISVFSNNNITDGGENTYDNVSDNKIINIIHNFYSGLNIKIPKTKSIIDNAEPRTSVSKLTSPEELGIKNPTTAEANNILDKSTKYLESVSNRSLVSSNSIYPHNNKISQDVNSDVNKKNTGAQWTKVVLLNVGDEIAVSAVALGEGRAVANSEALGKTLGVEERSGKTPSVEESADITFVKIKRITLLPPEQVYDIEVEGTHNFVANGIIAHNTYISGNTGIGTSTPNWNLQVAGARPFLTLSDTSALTDSKHWFLSSQGGNFYIGTSTDALNATSTYLTIDNKGYVGIGTAAPSQALSIAYGNIAFNFITAPTAPTAATGAAGNLTGNYYYKVTFITANGETELGATSNLIQPSAQQVELTNIPVSTETGVTQRKIYRTKAGTTSYWQLATLSNNTTTVYTDNIADASLPGTTNAVNRSNTTAGRFYVDGTQAGFIDKKFNLSLGIYSLNALTTGYNNVALGGYSLLNNTSGSMNLGLGYQSLFNTTTGSNNTGMGNAVLQGNTTGTGNVGLGSNALKFNQTGNYNIAIGLDAGLGVSANSISKNLAIGYQAGYALQTGADNNILIGYKTGDNITTGNTNIVIGYDIDAPSATSAKTLNIGNLIFGTGINGTGTTLSSGNIGIGTTNPLQKLHVEGQCVTGDSELITEDGKKLRIDQVKGGEYVLSLNEKTGKIVPAKIKGLLDMGVKPIYEIETEDGKKIRTTGNHSYLARNEQNKGLDFLGVMAENKETGQHQDTETNINKNVSSGNHNNKLFLTFHDGDKNNQSDYYNYAINNKWDHNLEDLARLGFGAIENSYAKHSQDDNSGNDVNNGISHNKLISVFSNNNITNDGENTYDNVSDNKIIDIIHNFYSGFNIKIPKTKSIIDNAEPRTSVSKLTSPENPGIKNPTTAEANNILDKSTKYLESVSNRSLVSSNSIYPHNNKTSQDVNSDVDKKNGAQWIKVAFLNEGDEIAVANSEALGKTLGVEEQSGKTPSVEESADITFVKIKRISLLPPEQVYDIEVEGTHNFVANGIIAHNTYISGNTGIGTTSPQALLTVGSSTLAYLLDGDRYNSLYVSGLFEIGGTGTSTMAGNLDIKGALNVGASSLYIDNTGTIKNGIWQGTSIDSTYISSSASWNNKWDLASTTIGVAYGGTGLTSATAGYALIGYNSSSFQATSTLFISPSGSVGIGTIEPTYKLDIYDVSNPQLGLINIAGSATTTFWADSVGDLRISASGGDIRAQNENIWVCSGGACGATAPAGKGNIILERALIFDNNFNIVASTTAVATSTEVYDSGGNAIIIFDEGE